VRGGVGCHRSWRALPSGKPDAQRIYANIAIEAALTIRMVAALRRRIVCVLPDGSQADPSAMASCGVAHPG
jgi:hypothetical protein